MRWNDKPLNDEARKTSDPKHSVNCMDLADSVTTVPARPSRGSFQVPQFARSGAEEDGLDHRGNDQEKQIKTSTVR